MEEQRKESPALQLLKLVWDYEGSGWGKSWIRFNGSMYDALDLAILSGLRFDPDDFKFIFERMRFSRWSGEEGIERAYRLSCHGISHCREHDKANVSACQAIEKAIGRPPFIFKSQLCPKGKRLAIGSQIWWGDNHFFITSFKDADSFVACSYRYPPYDGNWIERGGKLYRLESFDEQAGLMRVAEVQKRRAIVAKRLVITREQLRSHNEAFEAAVRQAKEEEKRRE